MRPTALGYFEVPCGSRREALFSRSEIRGVVRWRLDFIRFDGEIPEDRTIYAYMPEAVAAILFVVAMGGGKEAKAARREIALLRDEEAKSRQFTLFADA